MIKAIKTVIGVCIGLVIAAVVLLIGAVTLMEIADGTRAARMCADPWYEKSDWVKKNCPKPTRQSAAKVTA